MTRQKKYQQRKLSAGLCKVGCGRPRQLDRTMCDQCGAAARGVGKKDREKRKARGICMTNGCERPPQPGRVRCQECLGLNKIYRDKRRALGQCLDGCGRRSQERRTQCEECASKSAWRAIERKYGLSREQWMEMYATQNGSCAICHRPGLVPYPGRSRKTLLVVDHCHKTGKLRSLLCFCCNVVLGLVDDSANTLQNAIEYLESHGR